MLNLPRLVLISLAACGAATAACAAETYSTDWQEGLKSSARLIAGAPTAGVVQVGVEIKLARGAVTYWRNPGDSGVPPTLSFEGSTNLAQARVSFPAPHRVPEPGGGQAFGYENDLVLPIEIEPVDAAKPVEVALKLTYAVCENICVPAQAKLRLAVPVATAASSPYDAALAEARALTPRPVDWTSLGAALTAAGERTWRLCLAPQAGPRRDAFIEPPEGWWFDVAPDAAATAAQDCFTLKLAQIPAGASWPVSVRITLTGGAGPVEAEIALKAPLTP